MKKKPGGHQTERPEESLVPEIEEEEKKLTRMVEEAEAVAAARVEEAEREAQADVQRFRDGIPERLEGRRKEGMQRIADDSTAVREQIERENERLRTEGRKNTDRAVSILLKELFPQEGAGDK